MISNILPIVALASAAMAACPLSVEIAGATDHIAHVAVTNTGNETLTVFKGNTVFSDHATKDLLISNAGMLSLPHQSKDYNLIHR
jgi:deuterolysin